MKGCTKIQPAPQADRLLDRIAEMKGFGTRNTLMRHIANELSRVRPENFLDAMAVLTTVGRGARSISPPMEEAALPSAQPTAYATPGDSIGAVKALVESARAGYLELKRKIEADPGLLAKLPEAERRALDEMTDLFST